MAVPGTVRQDLVPRFPRADAPQTPIGPGFRIPAGDPPAPPEAAAADQTTGDALFRRRTENAHGPR